MCQWQIHVNIRPDYYRCSFSNLKYYSAVLSVPSCRPWECHLVSCLWILHLLGIKKWIFCSHGKWDCDYISKTGMCLGLIWCLYIWPLEGRLSHVIYLCVFVTTYRSQNKISTSDILYIKKTKQKGGNSNHIFPFLMYTYSWKGSVITSLFKMFFFLKMFLTKQNKNNRFLV